MKIVKLIDKKDIVKYFEAIVLLHKNFSFKVNEYNISEVQIIYEV